MQLQTNQMDVGDPVHRMQAVTNHPKKETLHSAASNSDTLIHSIVTIIPIHINYEEERCQHTIVGVHVPIRQHMLCYSVTVRSF